MKKIRGQFKVVNGQLHDLHGQKLTTSDMKKMIDEDDNDA